MNYLLVSPENLEGKYNYQFAERLPDGRVILPISVAKMITGLKGVDMVGIDELRFLKLQDNQVEGEDEGKPDSEYESSSDESFIEYESSSDEGFIEYESSSDEGFSESESSSDEQTNEESEVANE